jgi:hypothetical protein
MQLSQRSRLSEKAGEIVNHFLLIHFYIDMELLGYNNTIVVALLVDIIVPQQHIQLKVSCTFSVIETADLHTNAVQHNL